MGNDNATWTNIAIAKDIKTTYDNEIGSKSLTNQQTDSENIGLLYVSDYLYGASSKNWSKQSYTGTSEYNNLGKFDKESNPVGEFPEHIIDNDYRSTTDSNWLYMGLWDWLITREFINETDSSADVFRVGETGYVTHNCVGVVFLAIRPTFYITNDTKIDGGTGTIDNPYTISFE